MALLETIQSPRDLKILSLKQLEELAGELRDFLVENVSSTGGHIAPSLGVVELTLAIHSVYNSPQDKIIWDVGHQAYVHKILTGRRKQFHTLRTFQGISGFPRRSESDHDVFGTGHSSTSISSALGISEAGCFQNQDFRTVAVIGDGSMTGGLAYEGLNNATQCKADPNRLLVILNDNSMSISPNVGGMPKHLNNIITGDFYNTLKGRIEKTIEVVPHLGKPLVKFSRRLEEYLKGLITPGLIFEEFDFRYFGPVDGHNIHTLLPLLQRINKLKDGPFFLHVVTQKGKGFRPAEENPVKFHGLGPFHKESGECKKSGGSISHTGVFSKTLVKIAEEEKKLVAITAAMAPGTGLSLFQERFPERFYDVGIAEQHAVTFAAGLATQDMLPVVAIYSTFLQRSFDQIIHDVALQELPVFFCLDRAGLVGEDGPTHHGTFDLSYLRMIPNIVIMSPRDGKEFEQMIAYGVEHLKKRKGPIAVRYPRGAVPECPDMVAPSPLQHGKGQKILSGQKVAVLTLGRQVSDAWEAIQKTRLPIGLYNVRFAKPLDEELLEEVLQQYEYLVIIEENSIIGGIYEGLTNLYCRKFQQKYPDKHLVPLCLPDEFIPHGKVPELLSHVKMDTHHIAGKLRELYNENAS